jgi:CRP-like cAMP-binding protein
MNAPHDTGQNNLLAALTPDEATRLTPHLELVSMPFGEAYYESGGKMQYVYFPITAIVSVQYVTENGATAEIAVVGNEGVLGISLFMGGGTTPNRASVRSAGYGYKLKAQVLMDEFNRGGPWQHVLLRYTQALMTETAQTAVCNRYHSVEQQLCRWLLLTLDRTQSNELILTQELAANMLGVRREGITEVAGKLQKLGYIHYRRGHITVLDRTGLEAHACECYAVVRAEFKRLLDHHERAKGVPVLAYNLSKASHRSEHFAEMSFR